MQYPFKDGKPRKISSSFGMRTHPITKEKKLHAGVDMVAAIPPVIVAPENGTVLEARLSDAPGGGYGYYVKLKGKGGREHILAHMTSALKVKKGDRIVQGTPVGKMGNSGASTGRHLHWEVRVNGKPVDPIQFVD
nr:MAG TPA: Membrane protein [Caudoviricetes sp.]